MPDVSNRATKKKKKKKLGSPRELDNPENQIIHAFFGLRLYNEVLKKKKKSVKENVGS